MNQPCNLHFSEIDLKAGQGATNEAMGELKWRRGGLTRDRVTGEAKGQLEGVKRQLEKQRRNRRGRQRGKGKNEGEIKGARGNQKSS